MADKPAEKHNCPIEAALSLFSVKYKAIIIRRLLHDGALRRSDLRRSIPGITAKMLAQQLRELEADGLVHREACPAAPPGTEYSLTERGRTLAPLIEAICRWGRTRMAGTL